MAARYWVGGGSSTSWTAITPTNWAATSGGANNQSVPTSADDVFFDGNSGSAVTWPTGQAVQTIDFNGYTGTLTFAVNGTFTVAGNGGVCRFSAGMTIAALAGTIYQIIFTGTSGTILLTTNGKAIAPITLNGVGVTVQLQDALAPGNGNAAALTITAGTFDANNFNVSLIGSFASAGTLTRRCDMGSGQWQIGVGNSASSVLAGLNLAGSNFTLNAQTSTLVLAAQVGIATSTIAPFSPNGFTFNDCHIYGATIDMRQVNLSTTGIFNTLTLHGPNLMLVMGTNLTATSFVFADTSDVSHIAIGNINVGQGVVSLIQASGTVNANWCVIVNCSASGGAAFNAYNSFGIQANPGWTIWPPSA